MNSLGWSRRAEDEPVNTSQQNGLLSSIKSLNPFGDRGYVRLPTTEGAGAPLPAPSRREEEEGWFTCEYHGAFKFNLYTRLQLLALCQLDHADFVWCSTRGHVSVSHTDEDWELILLPISEARHIGKKANFWDL